MIEELPNRQSIRKKSWDYTAAGAGGRGRPICTLPAKALHSVHSAPDKRIRFFEAICRDKRLSNYKPHFMSTEYAFLA